MVFTKVAVTDVGDPKKNDAAEKNSDQNIKLKIKSAACKESWVCIYDISLEWSEAESVKKSPHDALIYFFTSGTAGNLKVVVKIHFGYSKSHLTKTSWVACNLAICIIISPSLVDINWLEVVIGTLKCWCNYSG